MHQRHKLVLAQVFESFWTGVRHAKAASAALVEQGKRLAAEVWTHGSPRPPPPCVQGHLRSPACAGHALCQECVALQHLHAIASAGSGCSLALGGCTHLFIFAYRTDETRRMQSCSAFRSYGESLCAGFVEGIPI